MQKLKKSYKNLLSVAFFFAAFPGLLPHFSPLATASTQRSLLIYQISTHCLQSQWAVDCHPLNFCPFPRWFVEWEQKKSTL